MSVNVPLHGQIYQDLCYRKNENIFFCGHCFDDRQCLSLLWRNIVFTTGDRQSMSR